MKIEKGTIIRTTLLGVALVNQVLVSSGHSIIPLDDATIETGITIGFTVVTSLIAWWKNNSFTQKAINADQTMKDGK